MLGAMPDAAASERLEEKSASADRSAGLQGTLDALVPALLTEEHLSGVSIARIDHHQINLFATYGLQSPGVPATKVTLYTIASMAKPVSAEVVLRLAVYCFALKWAPFDSM
jgi:CubicO group peptidase (beta-lactamase class C family)